VVVLAWSLSWLHANALALSAPMTWRSVTCAPGAHCVSRWTDVNTLQRHFRRNSATYLAELETRLVKLILSP